MIHGSTRRCVQLVINLKFGDDYFCVLAALGEIEQFPLSDAVGLVGEEKVAFFNEKEIPL